MKKRGKYEKIPAVPVAAEAKKTILQTYVTSLISLMLCVTMFFGTTAAWFTSEVESVDNEIYVGILDVDLMKKVGNTGTEADWSSLKNVSDESDGLVFDKNIKWEPNAMTIETLKVVDMGDLSFRYRLNLIVSETNKSDATMTDEVINAIASQFDVYMRDETHREGVTFSAPANADEVTGQQNDWTLVGTLADVLAGKVNVFEGNMTAEAVTAETPAEHTYSIALHMKSEATGIYEDSEGNAQTIMGKRLYLNVKLVAAQNPSEKDEFGNSDYDKVTEVINAEELQAALEQGGHIVLMSDIVLEEAATVDAGAEESEQDKTATIPEDKNVILDLNGHKITGTISNKGNLTINGKPIAEEGENNATLAIYCEAGATVKVAEEAKSAVTVTNAQAVAPQEPSVDEQTGYAIYDFKTEEE